MAHKLKTIFDIFFIALIWLIIGGPLTYLPYLSHNLQSAATLVYITTGFWFLGFITWLCFACAPKHRGIRRLLAIQMLIWLIGVAFIWCNA